MQPSPSNLAKIMAWDRSTQQVERIVVGAVSLGIYLEHVGRYLFAATFAEGMRVLDAACGTGYGSYCLALGRARRVDGLEISREAVAYAGSRYRRDNLHFSSGDAARMPYRSGSFDLIISFETIEHLQDPEGYLAECKRVLKPGSTYIVSTPDKRVHEGLRVQVPFHELEYSPEEFKALVVKQFSVEAVWGQTPVRLDRLDPREAGPSRALRVAALLPQGLRALAKPWYEARQLGVPMRTAYRYYREAARSNAAIPLEEVPQQYRVVPEYRLGNRETYKTIILVARS
jgi:2-polyprenyl-3-methyl-5-hydroxy-6-metoxy-1,4-benzoquinol methylase